jgi:hypothetical protein
MELEEALRAHAEQVAALVKSAGRYVSALKAWQKACATGHLSEREKAAAKALEVAAGLPAATEEASAAWSFDGRGWLESGAWREEIRATAAEQYGLRVLPEDDLLVSSPVLVRAQPARVALLIGRENWPKLRPQVVAAQLKALRERTAGGNSQQLVDSLQAACEKLGGKGADFVKFKDAYDLFSLTPGWKKDNPPAAFAQALYALHRSGLTTTRRGATFQFEFPSGDPRKSDVFTVIAEDGRPIRYYGLFFRD